MTLTEALEALERALGWDPARRQSMLLQHRVENARKAAYLPQRRENRHAVNQARNRLEKEILRAILRT